MKTTLQIIMTFALAAGAWAGPLPRAHVSAQARWVVHFDAERFHEGKFGAFYVSELMPRHLDALEAKTSFDFGPFFRALKSATAYGTEHGADAQKSAVLLLQSEASAVRGVKDFLSGAKGGGKKAQRVTGEPFPLYRLDKDTFIATLHEGRVLLGKSQEHLHAAWAVIEDQRPSLTTTTAFREFNDETNRCILAAGADGFGENIPWPGQSKLLRKTDGLRVFLDERGDNLFLSLAVQADSERTAALLKKLLDGVAAWAELEKDDDANVQALVQSANISVSGRKVTASLEYPVTQARAAAKAKALGK